MFQDVQVDDRSEGQEPELYVVECECGRPDCDRVIIAMVRPQPKPLTEDPNTIASLVYLPKLAISGMVKKLRELQNK